MPSWNLVEARLGGHSRRAAFITASRTWGARSRCPLEIALWTRARVGWPNSSAATARWKPMSKSPWVSRRPSR
jgi:hypothetical protein